MEILDLRDIVCDLDSPEGYYHFTIICYSKGRYDFSDPIRELKYNNDWEHRLHWDKQAKEKLHNKVVKCDDLLYLVVFEGFGYFSEFIPL